MLLLSRYLLKTTAITTFLFALILTLIIWLTQSLRLLDFVINGGAPVALFGQMLVMTVPRFFEIILPLSLAFGIVYSLNKFSNDSELVVMQNSGASPLRLSTGLLGFTVFIALFIFVISAWLTPMANLQLEKLRNIVKSEYSLGLLRPGIFNQVGSDTTVYIAKRSNLQDLSGVFIHFNKTGEAPSTIMADKGGLIMHQGKPHVVVFDGMRQTFNPRTGSVETLRFERYNIDLSSLTKPIESVSPEPNEQSIQQLLHSYRTETVEKEKRNLNAELHRRFSRPFLALAFGFMCLTPFMIGNFNRRGQSIRITHIILSILLLQILNLVAAPWAAKSFIGIAAMYLFPLMVIIGSTILMIYNGPPVWVTHFIRKRIFRYAA